MHPVSLLQPLPGFIKPALSVVQFAQAQHGIQTDWIRLKRLKVSLSGFTQAQQALVQIRPAYQELGTAGI